MERETTFEISENISAEIDSSGNLIIRHEGLDDYDYFLNEKEGMGWSLKYDSLSNRTAEMELSEAEIFENLWEDHNSSYGFSEWLGLFNQ
ncbi:MAG: hypothetical protein AAF226_09895 [Verrucomicrobiota bacterium]